MCEALFVGRGVKVCFIAAANDKLGVVVVVVGRGIGGGRGMGGE